MKKIVILALGVLALNGLKAQQDPQYTQWMYDKLSFNPAFAGFGCDDCFGAGGHAITLLYRDQWDGLNRDPKTALLNYNGNFGNAFGPGNLGAGVTFYSDNLGQERNSMIRINAAYHIPLSGGNILSAGIGLGQFSKTLGNDWIAIDDPANDPLIPNEESTASAFDANLGVYFTRPGEYYVGLSSTHLSQAELENLSITVNRHYYFMGGYNYDVTPGYLTLRGNVLAKTDLTEYIADINVNALFNDMIWAGLTYRTQDAVAPMAGFKYSWDAESETQITHYCFRLGYSYDATTSALRNYSAGSHEVFATLCLNLEPIILRTKFSNPRFL